MDRHASECANRILDNPPHAVVVECVLQGARFQAVADVWIALTGADASANVPMWEAVQLRSSDIVELPRNRAGVWTYLAVEGGFEAERWAGSASVFPRGGLGVSLAAGALLEGAHRDAGPRGSGFGRQAVAVIEPPDYTAGPTLRVWRGPQWGSWPERARRGFFERPWTVSSRSDRAGYRLHGDPMEAPAESDISEPVRVGTVQVPGSGHPIVTMRDGPTVGGYPKLALLQQADVSRLAQCRPGSQVRFQLIE
jgi:biotin-dependent carboxylase-like uncharacterized protein